MTIKFSVEIEATGDAWYKVYIDGKIEACKRDENEAKEIYNSIVRNAKNGLPNEKTIEEVTINTN